MNLKNLVPSENVLDCVPYAAPVWTDLLSSFSIVLACFTIIFMVIYHAPYYLLGKTTGKYLDEYSDYP